MTVSQFVVIEFQSLSTVNSTVYMFVAAVNSYCLDRLLEKDNAKILSFTYFIRHKFLYTLLLAVAEVNAEKLTGKACCKGLLFNVWAVIFLSVNIGVFLLNVIYYNCGLTMLTIEKR